MDVSRGALRGIDQLSGEGDDVLDGGDGTDNADGGGGIDACDDVVVVAGCEGAARRVGA